MIKGCQRRMIVLKDTGSDFFDEAYFVLKSNPPSRKISSEKEFIAEANRIVSEYSSGKSSKLLSKAGEGKRKSFLFGLAAGLAFGVALCLAAFSAGIY